MIYYIFIFIFFYFYLFLFFDFYFYEIGSSYFFINGSKTIYFSLYDDTPNYCTINGEIVSTQSCVLINGTKYPTGITLFSHVEFFGNGLVIQYQSANMYSTTCNEITGFHRISNHILKCDPTQTFSKTNFMKVHLVSTIFIFQLNLHVQLKEDIFLRIIKSIWISTPEINRFLFNLGGGSVNVCNIFSGLSGLIYGCFVFGLEKSVISFQEIPIVSFMPFDSQSETSSNILVSFSTSSLQIPNGCTTNPQEIYIQCSNVDFTILKIFTNSNCNQIIYASSKYACPTTTQYQIYGSNPINFKTDQILDFSNIQNRTNTENKMLALLLRCSPSLNFAVINTTTSDFTAENSKVYKRISKIITMILNFFQNNQHCILSIGWIIQLQVIGQLTITHSPNPNDSSALGQTIISVNNKTCSFLETTLSNAFTSGSIMSCPFKGYCVLNCTDITENVNQLSKYYSAFNKVISFFETRWIDNPTVSNWRSGQFYEYFKLSNIVSKVKILSKYVNSTTEYYICTYTSTNSETKSSFGDIKLITTDLFNLALKNNQSKQSYNNFDTYFVPLNSSFGVSMVFVNFKICSFVESTFSDFQSGKIVKSCPIIDTVDTYYNRIYIKTRFCSNRCFKLYVKMDFKFQRVRIYNDYSKDNFDSLNSRNNFFYYNFPTPTISKIIYPSVNPSLNSAITIQGDFFYPTNDIRNDYYITIGNNNISSTISSFTDGFISLYYYKDFKMDLSNGVNNYFAFEKPIISSLSNYLGNVGDVITITDKVLEVIVQHGYNKPNIANKITVSTDGANGVHFNDIRWINSFNGTFGIGKDHPVTVLIGRQKSNETKSLSYNPLSLDQSKLYTAPTQGGKVISIQDKVTLSNGTVSINDKVCMNFEWVDSKNVKCAVPPSKGKGSTLAALSSLTEALEKSLLFGYSAVPKKVTKNSVKRVSTLVLAMIVSKSSIDSTLPSLPISKTNYLSTTPYSGVYFSINHNDHIFTSLNCQYDIGEKSMKIYGQKSTIYCKDGNNQFNYNYNYNSTIFCTNKVTLLGEINDWIDLKERTEKLKQFENKDGEIKKMVRSIFITNINGNPADTKWWDQMANSQGSPSECTFNGINYGLLSNGSYSSLSSATG
ncbi:hypothetical protein ACTA71_000220 [Dictyostelium dimigraforme]